MPTWTIPPLFVLLPILVLGVITGLRRGWKDEVWACGGLLITVAIVSRPESVLLPTLERVISVFLRAGQRLHEARMAVQAAGHRRPREMRLRIRIEARRQVPARAVRIVSHRRFEQKALVGDEVAPRRRAGAHEVGQPLGTRAGSQPHHEPTSVARHGVSLQARTRERLERSCIGAPA